MESFENVPDLSFAEGFFEFFFTIAVSRNGLKTVAIMQVAVLSVWIMLVVLSSSYSEQDLEYIDLSLSISNPDTVKIYLDGLGESGRWWYVLAHCFELFPLMPVSVIFLTCVLARLIDDLDLDDENEDAITPVLYCPTAFLLFAVLQTMTMVVTCLVYPSLDHVQWMLPFARYFLIGKWAMTAVIFGIFATLLVYQRYSAANSALYRAAVDAVIDTTQEEVQEMKRRHAKEEKTKKIKGKAKASKAE